MSWPSLSQVICKIKLSQIKVDRNFGQLIITCIIHLPHHHLLSPSFLSYPSFLSCLSSCPFCLSFLSCLSSFCLHPTVAIRKVYNLWQNFYTCKIFGRHMCTCLLINCSLYMLYEFTVFLIIGKWLFKYHNKIYKTVTLNMHIYYIATNCLKWLNIGNIKSMPVGFFRICCTCIYSFSTRQVFRMERS